MSEFLIDIYNTKIWYDLKSDTPDDFKGIITYVSTYERNFYVRPHNENGPAVFYTNGDIGWCLNNECYPFDEWCKKLNKSEEEINFLKLKWNII